MFCELCLCRLPGAAIFAIYRRFDDYTRSTLVRGLRNLKVYVAIGSIRAGLLYEGSGDVKGTEFPASPWGIGGHKDVLCPTQNGIDADFFGSNVGNGDVLGDVAKIGDVRFDGKALTEIFRCGLQYPIVASFARTGGEPENDGAAKAQRYFDPDLHPADLDAQRTRLDGCSGVDGGRTVVMIEPVFDSALRHVVGFAAGGFVPHGFRPAGP
jgi:hypothetical protein